MEYSIENLKGLMATSKAYAELSEVAKENINTHIENNNENVLRFVFHVLKEEAEKVDFAFEEMSRKLYEHVQKITYQSLQSLSSELSVK